MKAKWRVRWTGLALLVMCGALDSVHALDRSDLLFQAGLDGRTDAGFARGDRTAHADYQPRFIDGVRGQAAVVGPRSGRVAPPVAPVDFWLDVAIPVTYRNQDIGALRYAQAQNLDWREGTLAFWAKPLDWASGDGANHYLAHFNMRDMLSFVYSPYVGWVEFRRSRISDRNDYCKFLATRANLPREAWRHIAVAWRGQELWTYLDGELCKTVSEGVPRVEGGGEWLAFGEANAATTAFDEMLALNRAVTPVEAEALFRRIRQATAGPVLTVPATTAAPVLDGKLAADEYARAARVTGWIDELLGVGNDDPTEFLVNYDETHLYVAVRFPVPAKYHEDPVVYVGNPLRLKAKGEDADLSGDDHIEIVLRPAGSSDEYRFGLTGAGARFDARNSDRDWDGDWRWQTHADEESWMVEIALPFALFGRAAPARQEQWEANFRHRALQVIDWGSIWAYSGPEPDACGTLVFGGDGPFVKLDRLSPPRAGAFEVAGRVVGASAQPPASWLATVAIGTNTVLEPVPEAADRAGRPDDAEAFRRNLVLDRHAATGGVFKVAQVLDRPLAADLAAVVRDAAGRVVFHQRIPFADAVTTTMGASMLPSRGAVLIEIDAGSIAAVERGLGAAIAILDGDGRTVREQTVAKLESVLSAVTLDVADLPAGVYTARVQLQAKDQARAPMEQAFEIWPKPEWLGNTIGITDEVLPPWTPLAYTGGTLSCWGRQLDVGQSLLPERIDVLGETLFAAPPALTLTAGGKTNRLSRASVRFTRRDPQRAEFTAETETPGFRITTENWIEYDGFQWITLTVTPKQPGAEVQELALELPFRREIATHWFNGEYRPDSLTGYLPDKPLRHGPANLARFGTAERGLQWCWQETYRWRLEKPSEALELLPGPDAYRVRLTFIDHAVKLDEPWRIEFGLHALPSRPQPRGYHGPLWGATSKDRKSVKEMPLVALWTHAWEIWNTPEMPVERMDHRRKRVLRDWKNSRMIHCTYCNHTTTSPLNTTYRYFYNEWRTVPSSRPNFKAVEAMTGEAARKNNSAQICYGSESYRDWYCYHLDKNLRHWRGEDPQVPVGLYFDTSGPTTCANAYHDHGVVIDGERKPYLAILTWRELSKRLRTIIKDVDPDAWLTVHMSGRPVPAYWGFYDIMIPGEQYAAFFTFKKAQAEAAGKPWPYDYTVMTQLDRVRAEYSSQGFGPAQVFLSEIWNFARGIPEAEQLPALRHLVGLLFVNDIRTWGGGRVELEVLEALWRHFGWDDEIVFHPYWRNQALIQPAPYDENRLVASLFTRRGRAFLFPFNNTDEAVEMTFDLRLEPVGVDGYAGGFLWDPLGGQRFPLTETRVTVPVPPRDFRLLLLLPPGTDTASLTAP